MTNLFVYQGPHPVHAAWARSVGAKFLNYRFGPKWMIKNRWTRAAAVISKRISLNFLKTPQCVIAEGGAPLVVTTIIKATKRCKMVYLCADPTPMSALNNDTLADLVGFSDLIIAVSKMALDDTKKLSRVKNSIVIYPFPNETFIELSKENVPIKDDSTGVFIGTQTRWKGAHLLPELAKKIGVKESNFRLTTIGRPTLGLEKTKHLIPTGFIPESNKIAVLSSAKVYLHPAIFEACGVSVLEAICAGTIPVVSNRTGAKEFLPSELVAEDFNELAEKAIVVLNTSRDEYITIVEKLRRKVRAKARPEISINAFKQAILSLE